MKKGALYSNFDFLRNIYFTKTTKKNSFLVHFLLRRSKIETTQFSKLFPNIVINEI